MSPGDVFEPAAPLVYPPHRLAVGGEQQDGAVVDGHLDLPGERSSIPFLFSRNGKGRNANDRATIVTGGVTRYEGEHSSEVGSYPSQMAGDRRSRESQVAVKVVEQKFPGIASPALVR